MTWLRILGVLGLIAGAAVLSIRFLIDRDAAEKIATALVMPGGLLWLMLIALCLERFITRKKNSVTLSISPPLLCLLLYTIAGSGWISEILARQLEAPYLAVNPLNQPVPEIVIVLGGGGSQGANGRLQGNSSGDRLILAAQLYHRSPSTHLICTGQRIVSMNASGIDPGETSRDILMRLGVPEASIDLVGGRNTSEELKNLAARLNKAVSPPGLLTSAWHLPRATRLATRYGLKVIPLPADFRSSPPEISPTLAQKIESLIPNGAAFGSNWAFAKEFLGMLLGR